MKYFLDTEFFEDGKTIDLISIGIKAEDGREFYRCCSDADLKRAASDPWINNNVLVHLPDEKSGAWSSKRDIAGDVERFLRAGGPDIEIWAYYADYDWVVFCQLFGRMIDLPIGFPMFCRDIKQLYEELGGQTVVGYLKPPDPIDAHDALADARWNREFYSNLMSHVSDP